MTRPRASDAGSARPREQAALPGADGDARISTCVLSLVDTNILVYRFDARFPDKQRVATEVLRRGIADDSLRLPHQAIVEFVAVVTRPLDRGRPLLTPADAFREAEELLEQFEILYPQAAIVRTALRGAALYQLPWFDAHLWAYAEYHGLPELLSEDFEHGRRYGTVRVVNPFA
jgi:predicted nucleic acid-binding protein